MFQGRGWSGEWEEGKGQAEDRREENRMLIQEWTVMSMSMFCFLGKEKVAYGHSGLVRFMQGWHRSE